MSLRYAAATGLVCGIGLAYLYLIHLCAIDEEVNRLHSRLHEALQKTRLGRE
jgi:hypothetical protein